MSHPLTPDATPSALPAFEHSRAYHEAASQVIAGGVNSNVRLAGQPTPLCFESGNGARLRDIDGNEYID